MIAAQCSSYYELFRTSSKYCLTVTALEATCKLQPHSTLSTTNVELYLVVFLKSDRELTKQKAGPIKGTMNPVWNKMMPFYGLKYDDESIVFELKARKAFAENPILGTFEIPVYQLMLRASSSDTNEMTYEVESEFTRNVLSLRLELTPTLPPKLDDEFAFKKTIGRVTGGSGIAGTGGLGHSKSSGVFKAQDSSVTDANLAGPNDNRDLAYLTVNENYSCLLFDCGMEKPRRPSEKKRTSTMSGFFEGSGEEEREAGETAIKL